MIFQKKNSEQEQRKYIRLDSVYPVQFRLVSLDGKRFLSEWLQGFTNNISKGGLCLTVYHLNPEIARVLMEKQAMLSLEIEMPLTRNPVGALATVSWGNQASGEEHTYLLGLRYTEIDSEQNSRIFSYARTKKLFIPVIATVVLFLGFAFALNSYLNIKLLYGNKALAEQFAAILQESHVARKNVEAIIHEREELKTQILALEARIQGMDKERKQGKDQTKRIGQLNLLVERLLKEKTTLQERLIALQNKEDDATNELLRLDKRKVILERTNLEKMYRWLAVHQNSRTGLVASFEGDSDIAGWAFIYDQSLAAQAYMLFLDFERAKKLLTFFDKKAKRIDGRFVNAYYVSDGSPAEYSVHSGPNIWVGIAALHYTTKAKDTRFLSLAEQIAQAIIYLQNQDPEGGIRGGPGLPWYSTEHNLDAYAFFSMLYTITGKEDYRKARDKTLDWLLKHTYDKGDIPIKRGKGDATIATDTYAWSIASIGPQKLEDLQMNPDKIVEFAEQNCEVGVEYTRPDGTSVRVKGFDFAPQRHLARGGIVSSEWTAQMVITFRIMADFYYKKNMIAKARSYEQKADAYLGELSKMLIWSPSPTGQGEGCLPYASQDCVDTGHGWLTPKGKNTGSIAGTAYTLFAYSKYNPLELRKDRR